jgi:autotransporter-associated beta strand protein
LGSGAVTLNGGRLDFWVTNGQIRDVANNIALPSTGQQQFIVRAADGSAPGALGTGIRLTGILSGGAAGQTFRITDTNASGNHNNVLILDNPNNTMAGILEMWRGTLAITSDGALGNVSRIRHFTESENGSFRFDANNIVVAATREFEFVSASQQPINTQGFTATIAGPFVGTGLVTKQGTGILILTGTSTNSSPIRLDAGTLRVNGQTGTGNVTVQADTTLQGSGVVGGAVTVQTGGTIRGGDPTSSSNNALSFGNGLTTQSGASVGVRLQTLTPDVSSTNPASNSFLNIIDGTTTIDSGTNFLIDGSSLSFDPAAMYLYRIATGAGDQSSLLITDPARFSTVNFANAGDFTFSITGTSGGAIFLNVSPVPEPTALLGFGMAGLMGMTWLRRKTRRQVENGQRTECRRCCPVAFCRRVGLVIDPVAIGEQGACRGSGTGTAVCA